MRIEVRDADPGEVPVVVGRPQPESESSDQEIVGHALNLFQQIIGPYKPGEKTSR